MKDYFYRLLFFNRIINRLEKRHNIIQLQVFESILNQNNLSLARFNSILDFGCGQGRLVQHIPSLSKKSKIVGCDISHANILKCKRRIRKAHFFINEVHPPLSFESETFDFIYSYSVFTHLSEENHKLWLNEFNRVLKPNGVMLHTTHPQLCMRRIEMFSPEEISNFGINGSIEDFISNNHGYYYMRYSKDLPEYGVTLISKEYILNNWPRLSGMKIVEYVEGAIESYPMGYHDIVLMMKE